MRVGVDLGGTKIEAVALDDEGEPFVRLRVPTPSGDYEGTLRAIAALVASVERDAGGRAPSIGIGTPGVPSRVDGLMKNANSTVLIGKPLARDLAERLERPVRLANDANCFVLSEANGGAAAGAGVAFGVILGTGVGGGIAVNAGILEGRAGIAGEWGHNPLPWAREGERPGPRCYCGKDGCIETFLAGPRLARAQRESADSEGVMATYEDRLARALAHVVNVLDPDVVVLGGGVSNLERLYTNVPPLLGRYVFSDHTDTPVLRARYGDSSGVRGAALL